MKFGVNVGQKYNNGDEVTWNGTCYKPATKAIAEAEAERLTEKGRTCRVEQVFFVVSLDIGGYQDFIMRSKVGTWAFSEERDAAELGLLALTKYMELYNLGLLPNLPRMTISKYFESGLPQEDSQE